MTINYAIKPNIKPWNPQATLTTSNQVVDALYGIYQEEYKKNTLAGQLAYRTINGNFIVAGDISVQSKKSEELILISGTDKAIYVGNDIVLDGANNEIRITNGKITIESGGNPAIVDGVVQTDGIANLAVTTSKIDNLAVTNLKVASGLSASKITTGTMLFDRASGGTLILGGSGNGSGVFSLRNSVGTEIIAMDNTGITVKKTAGIVVTSTNSIELQQGGDLEMYVSPTFNPAAIVYFGVNQSKLAEIYIRAGAGITEGIIFDPVQSNKELYFGKTGDLWGQISLHATNLYLRGGFVIGDTNDALRHNQTIQVLSGSSGSFSLAHGGSSKPDYCYVNCCGGTNNYLVNTTWDYDSSDATNVLVEWATIDGSSYSSQSIRFHATFIWT